MAAFDTIAEAKARLRADVASRLADIGPDRRRAAGMAIAERLANLPAVAAARTVMAFLSMPTEIDTWPFIRWAWQEGKGVAVPRLAPAGRSDDPAAGMVAVALEPADVPDAVRHPALRPGRFGILTAPVGPPVPPEELDVILVPCLAVDRQGRRLGRGGGYYDRFLGRPEVQAACIALAWDAQVVDAVPTGPTDVPLDGAVTESRVLRFSR